jgi:hypothetical protein
MGEIDVWQVGFNAGELTPLLEGREDLLRFPNGCRKLRNAHGIIQGPARRRAGGKFVATTKSNGEAWMVRFVRSRSVAYMLEFGDNYIRFYRNRAQLLDAASPFAPYEVATPWTYADMTNADGTFKFKLVQSNDILYICSGTDKIKQLRRFGDVDWDLVDFETVGGPFDAQNTTATTVYASAQTGTVTLTASTAIFVAGHVGALFRIQPQDLSDVPPWEANVEYNIGDLVRNDGKTYESLTSNSGATGGKVVSGTRGPTHEEGSAADGSGQRPDPEDGTSPVTVDVGHTWEFQDPGYGVLKITAIGSGGTTATATVEEWRVGSNAQLPFYTVGSGNATTRWAFGLYSDVNGWPVEATFFRERFVMIGSRNFAFSVPALFTEFTEETAGQVLADNAFSAELSSDQDEEILWAIPTERLLVGTTGGEHAIGELTAQDVFGPLNRKSEPQTGYGSRPVAPWRVGQEAFFVESSGLRIRAMTQADNFRYKADSQNDLAEHIMFGGVVQTAWVPMPDNLFWCLTAEGNMPCLVYSKEQDVFGWSTHFIGGYRDASQMRAAKVTTINTIPNPDGDKDDLWYIAERTIDGNVVRYIEYVTEHLPKPQRWEFEPLGAYERRLFDYQADLVFVDSAATYDVPLTITDVDIDGGTGVVQITSAAHGLSNGDLVRIDGVIGTWEINARSFEIENVATNTFDLVDVNGLTDGVNGAPFTTYVSGGVARELVTTISGLDMWEGETLQVVTDGAVHPDRTVSSGSITLQYGAGRVHTGYNAKMVIETQRPIGGNEKGSAQGKVGRIVKLILRLEATLGGQVGPSEEELQEVLYRDAADLMDLPPALYNGDIEIGWPDGQSTVRTVTFVQDQPLPTTVVSLGIAQEVFSE